MPLAILALRPIAQHALTATDPYRFSDDVRFFVPAYFLDHGGLCRRDYTLSYNRVWTPAGVVAIYSMLAPVIDPATVSKVLPYPLLIFVIVVAAATARAIGGNTAAIATAMCICAAPLFLLQISGALPRSFAYPVHALTLFGAVTGQPYVIAVAALAGAAFYPPAGAFAAVVLASFLFVLPRSHRHMADRWHLARRIGTLAATAVVCLLLVSPTLLRQAAYGERIGPRNLEKYPEMDRGGRVAGPDVPPYRGVAPSAYDALRSVFIGDGVLPRDFRWLRLAGKLVIVICGVSFLVLARRSRAEQRLLLLPLAAVALYVVADVAAPYLYVPERYLAPLHLIEVVVVACGAAALLPRYPIVAMAATAVILLTVGDFTDSSRGLNVDGSSSQELMKFFSRDTSVTLVAGWPGGAVDNVPYLARKPALLTRETHGALHGTVILEKRRRMFAIIDAYYAQTSAPLARLRDEFGVTHLIVDRSHYHARPPRYFAPFRERIRESHARCRAPITMQVNEAVTFREGDLFVIDLQRLERVTRSPAPLPPAPVSSAAVSPAGHRRSNTPPALRAASAAAPASDRR